MNLELKGKVALVTGSSSGIGLAIARTLSEEGALVVLNGRNHSRLNNARKILPDAHCIVADVQDPKECRRLVEGVLMHHGHLDVLVCNVGSGASVPPGQETPEEWRRVLDRNLYPSTQMVWAAESALVSSGGNVICISSICAFEALDCPIPYAAAKAALESFIRNSARPLGKRGVRINSVAPGNILFKESVWDRKLAADELGVKVMLEREVALRSLGKPEDVARLVTYLASPLADFITGATFVIDGGQLRS